MSTTRDAARTAAIETSRRYYQRRATRTTPAEVIELFAQVDHGVYMLTTSGPRYADELGATVYRQLGELFDLVRGLSVVASFRREPDEKTALVENVETGERL